MICCKIWVRSGVSKLLLKQELCDADWEPSSIERILDGRSVWIGKPVGKE